MKIVRLLILALLVGLIIFIFLHLWGLPGAAFAEMKQSFFFAEIKQLGFGTPTG